jgi:serine/threonine protein kinase
VVEGTPPTPDPGAAPDRLGRYEVLKKLTSGGMAELLLARATGMQSFERHVVIKRIHAALARDQRFVTMFLEEARLAASLHHQNIVQVYDVGEQDGQYFFAMEYVHGEDLRKLHAKMRDSQQQVPIDIAISIVAAAAAGLHHAHEQRSPNFEPLDLVHRDVSLANILVGYDGSVKLLDFGLAKAQLRSVKTRTGNLKGKASYMSPEQCMGRPLDRRSDVFALGIVLYELLTTRRLFKAANDFMSMAAIVDSEVPPPSSHRADLPPALDEIVMRSLAKTRESRYPSAEAMRSALETLAIDSGMRTSTKALADYMHATFGERPEPWRSDQPTDQAPLVLDDEEGVVAAPEEIIDPIDRASSPIAIAHRIAEGQEPEFADESATVASPPPDDMPPHDPNDAPTVVGGPMHLEDSITGSAPIARAVSMAFAPTERDTPVTTPAPIVPRPPILPDDRDEDSVATGKQKLPPRLSRAQSPAGMDDARTIVAPGREPMYVGPPAPTRWQMIVQLTQEHRALVIAGAAALALAIALGIVLLLSHGSDAPDTSVLPDAGVPAGDSPKNPGKPIHKPIRHRASPTAPTP